MILVVGATGTVGRKVIDALLTNPNVPVRVVARGKTDWTGSLLPGFRRKGIEVVVGDVRSEKTIEKAVKDCSAIINCTGTMRSNPDEDIESVNIDGVQNLVSQGEAAGVQRFIQLSCIGATEHSTCHYFSSKWEAEEIIRKSKFYWTIFRPSLIFETESSLLRILDFWVLRSPITFVVGSGLNRFQPISATDVANCMVTSVYDRDTVGKLFELTGPETIDLQSLLTLAAEKRGRSAQTLRIPSFIGVPFAGLMAKLNPSCPIDNNVMQVLTSEMIGDGKPMLAKFANLDRRTIDSILTAIEATKTKSGLQLKKDEAEEDEESLEADDEEDEEDEEETPKKKKKSSVADTISNKLKDSKTKSKKPRS